MDELNFLTSIHTSTKRDYVKRVVEYDKADCARIAAEWGYDYWDGDRGTGYGGYHYDGRWRPVADAMAKHYCLTAENRVLDVGCGKAFLLYELTQSVPGISVAGVDISEYALENAKREIREELKLASASELPFEDSSFDLVISLNTLHNLLVPDLFSALHEIERVSSEDSYIVVESYRSEQEKVNLMCWQLTCESFYRPEEWEWIFSKAGYTGDHGFIYFE